MPLLRVVVPVAGGEGKSAAFLVDERLHDSRFATRVGDRRRSELPQQLVDGVDAACGLLLDLVGGVAWVAQEGRALRAQARDARGGLPVVVFAAAAAAGQRGLHQPLAQAPALERGERWLAGGVREAQQELAFLALGLRRVRGRRDLRLGQAGQLGAAIEQQRRGRYLLQHVLVERRPQRRELGIERLQLLLVGVLELCARAHKVAVVAPEQPLRLGVEPEGVASVVERGDAREQLGVEGDRVLVSRELGGDLALQLLDLRVGVGPRQAEEDSARAIEELAGALHGHDRVVEAGLLRVLRDRLDLLQVLGHAPREGGREVLVPDGVEARVAERQVAFAQQRVVGHGGGGRPRPGVRGDAVAQGGEEERRERK